MNEGKIVVFITFLFAHELTFAQVTDNFSDGDFTSNPPWSGDIGKFVVNTGKLKLQAPAVAETAFLSTSSEAVYDAGWEFYLQMDFNPSSTNYAKVYLVSDQKNLTAPLNGYFVKAGNTAREVSLYRQNGTLETKIIDGLDDRLNLTLVKVKIKVLHSASGGWQLFSDPGPTGNYFSEGIATDNTITASAYFGIQCVYTATRSDKFWFDDFVVTGSRTPDTTPPTILTVTAVNASQINLLFSETVDPSSAQEPANFSLSGYGKPSSVNLLTDNKTVQLYFSTPMVNGFTYDLQVNGVKDDHGNMLIPIHTDVIFFQPVPSRNKDVIFTEIFPDPSPQVGLPAAEFVEIYNRSKDPYDLAGWKLSDGSSTAIFPPQLILPGAYIIVTASSVTNLFANQGVTIGLTNFPTLNNDGETITLRNKDGLTIDSINYHLDWYRDTDKQEGGWTLELIDPSNPCGEQDNWIASENSSGGTPGKQNSVFAAKPDLTSPQWVSIFPDLPTRISLTFDEKLDRASISLENFILQPPLRISGSIFTDTSLKKIQIDLGENLIPRQLYTLQIENLRDCSGNVIQQSVRSFGLPEKADSLDVMVNEILFNPKSGGVDFIEIYNSSPKFLNLRNWKLSNFTNDNPVNITPIFPDNILFAPYGLVVLSTDPKIVKWQYPQSVDENLYKASLPSLPDDSGSVAILNEAGQPMDALAYSRAWHLEFIKNDEGVSLERISSEGATNDRNNWISASSSVGFATPGFSNSQGRGKISLDENVKVVPEIFTPHTGTNDFVQIQYHFDPGFVANVKVYDQQGHLLKTLAQNEILGTEGFFRWDGDRDDGSKARLGYYVVQFEVFDAAGTANTVHKRVIVSAK